MFPEFSKAVRVVQWSVLVNLAIVVAGLVVGGEVLTRLAGLAPADVPTEGAPDNPAAMGSGLAVMLLGMLGVVPSLGLSVAGAAYLSGRLVPDRIRQLAIFSLVLFCIAIGLVVLIGFIPGDSATTLRLAMRCLALVLSLASHALFLRALELSSRDSSTPVSTLMPRLTLLVLILWAAIVMAVMFAIVDLSMTMLVVLPTMFFVSWCLCYLWLLRSLRS